MPSRQLSTANISDTLPQSILPLPAPVNQRHHRHHHPHHRHLLPLLIGAAVAVTVLLSLAVLYRKLSRKRTAPADLKPPHKFTYSVLRRATGSFSASSRLGQGGFGSVYKGVLKSGQEVAVKVMDAGSLQGEREFQNELLLAGKIESSFIVSLIGYSSVHRKKRRMLLVYELMHNRSLQDALLDKKCPEVMEWKKRFSIAVDIAKGLEFLHFKCDPPVIHGDIKPSNILLDREFNAKIADFGLARSKIEEVCDTESVIEMEPGDMQGRKLGGSIGSGSKIRIESVASVNGEDNGSIVEETDSGTTGFEEVGGLLVSPESFVRVNEVEVSPETDHVTLETSASEILDKTSVSEGNFDKSSVDSGMNFVEGNRKNGKKKSVVGRDWWWRQDSGVLSESGGVKDYVMDWIGTEIKKERPKSGWISTSSVGEETTSTSSSKPCGNKTEKKKRLEWWVSMDEDRSRRKDKNHARARPRPAREWWREEFCEELTKKKKKREKMNSEAIGVDNWWQRDDENSISGRKRKKRSKSSVDWWLDGLSGEFRSGRRNSQDWTSGEILKSGGVSSTPSMRGTVCYIAPEYGGGGQLSEKCDVYSYGVLLLVLISGRRPLQVTASPMSEFERANLISWTKHLARRGKLHELFDPALLSLDQEQALLCITVALLCLQRNPLKRPNIKEVVGMLCGDSEPPHLPVEFSPSPPSNSFKSHIKAR